MKIEINVGFPVNYDFGILKKRFMHRITKVFGFLNLDSDDYKDYEDSRFLNEMDNVASICVNAAIGMVLYVCFMAGYAQNHLMDIPFLSAFCTSGFFILFKVATFAYFISHILFRIFIDSRKELEGADSLVKYCSFWFGFFGFHILTYIFFNIVL